MLRRKCHIPHVVKHYINVYLRKNDTIKKTDRKICQKKSPLKRTLNNINVSAIVEKATHIMRYLV